MGFFKNINASADFEVLERYIKNREWNYDLNSPCPGYYDLGWDASFNAIFDVTWSFKSVNGTYMIDSSILYEGSVYREVRTLKDTGVLFQAMIDKKPIQVIAGVKWINDRHIVIRLIFNINNGDRIILAYEIRRKMKILDNFRSYLNNFESVYDPNYNFKHNYEKQQQKFAKHHTGRNKW